VPQLALAAEQLHFSDGRIDTTSPPGRRECMTLLSCIDWAARALRTPVAPRAYRQEFTVNYRALFPDINSRHYRVDIFEAALQWSGTRWVNGERFDLSQDALHAAERLQCAWSALCAALAAWGAAGKQHVKGAARTELRAALSTFDVAWIAFEHRYVAELIDIEAAARGLVLRTVEEEKKLQQLEKRVNDGSMEADEQLREQRRRLLQCVARLNSAANLRWKGHEDRGAEVLEAAIAALKRCDSVQNVNSEGGDGQCPQREREVVQVLATGVVDAFGCVRNYLREVPNWIDSVHPHLCNNAGLVARVSAWTESWELGARYMELAPLLRAICDIVSAIHNARRLVPALAAMCDECDVELFLVLPRIVWLWFLGEPNSRAELLRRLLPNHFTNSADPPAFDQQLERFIASFRDVSKSLCVASSEEGPSKAPTVDDCSSADGERHAWEVLVTRVVAGPNGGTTRANAPSLNDEASPPGSLGSSAHDGTTLSADMESSVEAFVHELERWSMELQRHRPEDWCQCSAVLVRCLSGEAAPHPTSLQSGNKVPFCV